jgi:hypothetical protein
MGARRWLVAVVGLLSFAPPAFAAQAGPAKPFVAPRVSKDYLDRLARLPDWNGMWNIQGGIIFDPTTAYIPPDPAGEVGGTDFGPRPGSRFTGAPYKPEYRQKYDAIVKRAQEQGLVSDPVGGCMQPHGMPREMGGAPGPTEIMVTPGEVRITWNWLNATRRIYTDGRPHPKGDDLLPSFMGHSIGHWEGDTLVVDTIGMMAGIYDQSEAPHSDQIHLAERIRMVDADTLEDQMTITDPVMLERPWVVTRRYRRMAPDPTLILGAYCEGQRLEFVDGAQRPRLGSEIEPGR